MRNKYFFILLCVSLISCKETKKEEQQVAAEKNDNSFKVMMNMVVKNDDSFQLYYTEDGTDNYAPDKFIDVPVKGKETAQIIEFSFPEEVLPASLRFDVGGNKNQGEMKVIGFQMKYYDKNFDSKNIPFDFYFGGNDQIKFDATKGTITPILPTVGNYDPIFVSKPSLKDEINKMIK